jgi:IS605 OrfB family transposase
VTERPAYSAHDIAEVVARSRDDGYRQRVARLAWSVVKVAERSGRGIVLEDWTDFSRRKAAWVDIWRAIAQRAEARGVPVTQVNRAYTSVTCPQCQHRSRENRPARASFRCVRCGFSGHADVVAAMNIRAKADGSFDSKPGPCQNPECDEPVSWASGLCTACYFHQYRHGVLPGRQEREQTIERRRARKEAQRRIWEDRVPVDTELAERIRISHATHDAWGNPLESSSA